MELEPIRVVIIDDHPCVRNALSQYLASCPDILVVGTSAASDEGLKLATITQPHVAIVDLHLPYTGRHNPTPNVYAHGIRLISALRQQMSGTVILVLTGMLTPVTSQAALRAGAHKCLSKDSEEAEIADVIRAVSRRETLGREDSPTSLQSLTDRELEVLHLLGQGLTNRQIASQLYISELTVNVHLKHVYSKLGVSCRAEATSLALYELTSEPSASSFKKYLI